jgi:hypothetical protein
MDVGPNLPSGTPPIGKPCPRAWTASALLRVGRGSPDRGKRMNAARERAEQKRQAKLAVVRERGSLVIRKMTSEERRRYPPRPAQPRRVGKR